jgi:D-alanyl-lipoteichoic acid acyltransferase DltB (MBOAT superfamily)
VLFNTLQFALFAALVLTITRSVSPRLRPSVLLWSSLVFYALWIPIYLLLLLGDVAVNYLLLRAMVRSVRPRLFLALAVAFTLSVLACFKYAVFLTSSVTPLAEALLAWSPPHLDIVLPLGISFFSFQLLGLTIDVYRGDVEPPASFARYTLFIAFFPQLIAGPILRGSQLLPQLATGGAITPDRTRRGWWLIAAGLAKKSLLADFLLAPFVDQVFGMPGVASAPAHLIAVYAFAFQIYFDFSGYTDMARGIACLLGFELPLNFAEPYLSRNPVEFWRRWHMTLSGWLRDYLYIPLGGNRRGRARTDLNLFITMLLGGLWHGAAWNFVIWGGLHGAWLALHRLVSGGRRAPTGEPGLGDLPRIVLTFHAVCLLWIFFRANGFDDALTILTVLARGDYAHASWPLLQLGIVALCCTLQVCERAIRLHLSTVRTALGSTWGTAIEGALFGAIVGLAIVVSGAGGEFIYFQF